MDQAKEIREKLDIVSFINEFVPLKKAGRNFKANCPFHSENTPSFMVSPERQRWHCFGCQKGGDAFTFLMEYEHIEFPEALRMLAQRTGVTLSTNRYDSELSKKKERLYALNRLSAEFYHYLLTKHPAGKKALEYLEKRGVSEKARESFMIGMAPRVGNGLTRYLMEKKNYPKEDLYEAGLAAEYRGQPSDFFRDRIMFPLLDHRDNVVGFSGRTLDETGTVKAKYINTRETLIYHKGELFFGLNLTKDAIRKADQAILVEGEFDVISCFQNGVGNVMAVKGTALTEKQVQLLSRYAQKVTVCFDGDRAGQEAIKRSLPILEKHNLQTTVIVIPGGKDPDEAIKNSPAAFKEAVSHDIGIYDFLLDNALKTHDKRSAAGKGRIAESLLPIFSGIGNEIIKEHYLKKLSSALDTTYESLLKEQQRARQQQKDSVVTVISQKRASREEMLEEYLLSLIAQYEDPKAAALKAAEILNGALPAERSVQKVLKQLFDSAQKEGAFVSQEFASSLPSELLPTYDTAVLFPLASFPEPILQLREIEKTAKQLKDVTLRRRIKFLGTTIKEKEAAGEEAELGTLREEFSHLVSLLQK